MPCISVAFCPTKALRWGLGNRWQWVFDLLRLCSGPMEYVTMGVCPTKALLLGLGSGRADVMQFIGFLFYQSPAVGPRQCVAGGVCPIKAL